MQLDYFSRLSEPVQQFILEVEKGAGLSINVIPDRELNAGGPNGEGNLAIIIKYWSIQLFAPTNGYFPDGAVRHEVLHVKRFHVEGVPKIVLAERENWDKSLGDGLGNLDNAIEHLIIVPVELELHPERRMHWEAVVENLCSNFHTIPESGRRVAICLHWAFFRHVLPGSPSRDKWAAFAKWYGLYEMAEEFADQVLAVTASKVEMASLLLRTFPEIPLHRAALEYINSTTGTFQRPIPWLLPMDKTA